MSATVDILFRIEKGEELSLLEMDNNWRKLKIATDGLLLTASQQASPTSSRIGEIIQWGSNTLPINALWLNGVDISRTTYASLFAIWGTTFGAGNGTTTFTVPKMMGRLSIGASTIGGQTDTTFGTFTLGQYYGAKQNSVTFPTFSAGTKDTLSFSAGTKDTLSFSAGTKDALTFDAGAQGTLSGGAFPTITIAAAGAALTITGNACDWVTAVPEHVTSVMDCGNLTVPGADIAAVLKINTAGGSFQTLSAGTAPSASLSGYVAPSASLSGYVAPSASLSGYVAPSSTGGNATMSIIPPTVCLNFMTYYQ